ncbi:MAG TPA: hypothetical protein VI299_01190 [Polyangiales bacterium]
MNVLVLAPNTAHTHGDRMQSGMFGGAAAMSLCAAFVAQYVAPVLRPTQSTFKQLEHTTQAALEAAVLGLSKSMLDMPLSAKLRRCVERIVPAQRVQEVVELAGDRAERRCVVVARTAHALQRKRERVLEAGITFAPCPPEQRARPHTGRQCPWRS